MFSPFLFTSFQKEKTITRLLRNGFGSYEIISKPTFFERNVNILIYDNIPLHNKENIEYVNQ